MANQTAPINLNSGQNIVDQSVVPYIRAQQVEFAATSLRPYSIANFFFDETDVKQFVQVSSILTTNVGFNANSFVSGEGLYCSNTGAYASVIATSQDYNLYVNENYACLNLSPYGPLNSNSFSTTDYKVGDVIFLANNIDAANANTFSGRVSYWNSTDGKLAVKPLNGTVSNTAGNRVVYKIGSTLIANVENLVTNNKFPANVAVRSTTNTSNIFLTSSYTHRSGVVSLASANALQIIASGNVVSNAVNSSIYVTGGTGLGQLKKIISITSNTILNLNTALTVNVAGNSTYSIGGANVDEIGVLAGILNIPEDNYVKFQTGQRLFTINDKTVVDDEDAEMKASAQFVASGTINYTQEIRQTPIVTPPPATPPAANTTVAPIAPVAAAVAPSLPAVSAPRKRRDPVAQTFFVPRPVTSKQDWGMFVASVNIFFQAKPEGNSTKFPVELRLVTTENGYPTENILTSCVVDWADVKVADGVNDFPSRSDPTTMTTFRFLDPIYLPSNGQYAVVIVSESPDYKVWISQLGQKIVNTTRIVSETPYIGSFFRSQNASTWTPYQNEQLMFVINKAVFDTTPANILYNIEPPAQNVVMDVALVHSSDVTFPVANVKYKLKTVVANTGTQDTDFFSIENNVPYNFGRDLQNSSLSANRRRAIYAGNANSVQLQVSMSTTDTDVSAMLNDERLSLISFTNIINPGGLTNNNITITSGGNHSNVANITVTISAPTGIGGVQAVANVLPSQLVSNAITGINFTTYGSGYVTSPTITITEPTASSNAVVYFNGEDKKFGGNGACRYVTRKITLANGFDAGDIKLFMNAIKPQGTDIQVYYKVASASDPEPLSAKNWKQMFPDALVYSIDQSTPVGISYNTGDDNGAGVGIPRGKLQYIESGVTYPLGGKFKHFAIKIVLFANDPTVPPIVNNYRAICVPAG